MLKKTISTLSVLSFLTLGCFNPIKAIEKPATWLAVTAEGVPGSAPNPNTIRAKGKDTKISKNKCNKNVLKTLGAVGGGFFGASRGKSAKDKVVGAAAGAAVGAATGAALDGC